MQHNNIPEIFLLYVLLGFTVIKEQLIILLLPQWNLDIMKYQGTGKFFVRYNEVLSH